MTPLTFAEVAALPNDTPIHVKWSGGNSGDYFVSVDRWGLRYAAINTDPNDRLRFYNPLDFVGPAPFNTRVYPR